MNGRSSECYDLFLLQSLPYMNKVIGRKQALAALILDQTGHNLGMNDNVLIFFLSREKVSHGGMVLLRYLIFGSNVSKSWFENSCSARFWWSIKLFLMEAVDNDDNRMNKT